MRRPFSAPTRSRLPAIAVLAASAAYAAALSWLSIERYRTFHAGVDLGIFTQALWLAGEGERPLVTMWRALHALGDHWQPSLFLLTPLGALNLVPEALLVVQSLLLAAAAPVLAALARTRGASRGLAAALALLWLATPLTAYANLADFHPETALPVLLAAGALALERRRTPLFLVTAAVAIGIKEDVSLLYAAWGLALALRGRRHLGLGLVAAALLWFVLAVKVAIPALGGDFGYYSARLTYSNPVTTENARLVAGLVASSAGLCLLAPAMLLAAVPSLTAALLSSDPQQHYYLTYYHVPMLAVVAVAGALAAGRAEEMTATRLGRSWLLTAYVLAVAAVLLPFSPAFDAARGRHLDQRTVAAAAAAARRDALAAIPPRAAVAAQLDLVAHVAERPDAYLLPEPFVKRPASAWTAAELRARASTVRFVVLDGGRRDAPPEDWSEMLRTLRRLDFRPVFRRAGVRVLVRDPLRDR